MLQDVEEFEYPKHSFPLLYGPFFVLKRVLVPVPPHVSEQAPHDCHLFHSQLSKITDMT